MALTKVVYEINQDDTSLEIKDVELNKLDDEYKKLGRLDSNQVKTVKFNNVNGLESIKPLIDSSIDKLYLKNMRIKDLVELVSISSLSSLYLDNAIHPSFKFGKLVSKSNIKHLLVKKTNKEVIKKLLSKRKDVFDRLKDVQIVECDLSSIDIPNIKFIRSLNKLTIKDCCNISKLDIEHIKTKLEKNVDLIIE